MSDTNRTFGFDRRSFLRTAGTALGGLAVASGRGAAQSEWRYEFVGGALDAGTHETVVQGDRAYTANGTAIATVDVSDPEVPAFGSTALANGEDNVDVKVEGDLAALANDGDPPGVTFFDVSDPATPVELSFYEAASGVNNCFLDGDYAYLCVNDDFAHSRMVIVDVSDPTDPVSLEGDERGSGGAWMLLDGRRPARLRPPDVQPRQRHRQGARRLRTGPRDARRTELGVRRGPGPARRARTDDAAAAVAPATPTATPARGHRRDRPLTRPSRARGSPATRCSGRPPGRSSGPSAR